VDRGELISKRKELSDKLSVPILDREFYLNEIKIVDSLDETALNGYVKNTFPLLKGAVDNQKTLRAKKIWIKFALSITAETAMQSKRMEFADVAKFEELCQKAFDESMSVKGVK